MKFGADRRVRKRPEFQAIQRIGRRISTKHFVLIIAPSPSADAPPRLGITASKKVGNAVRRNRLKRLIRAAFQETGGWVPSGYDLVVICKADDPHLDTQTVVQEWMHAESRLKKSLQGPDGRKPRSPHRSFGKPPKLAP